MLFDAPSFEIITSAEGATITTSFAKSRLVAAQKKRNADARPARLGSSCSRYSALPSCALESTMLQCRPRVRRRLLKTARRSTTPAPSTLASASLTVRYASRSSVLLSSSSSNQPRPAWRIPRRNPSPRQRKLTCSTQGAKRSISPSISALGTYSSVPAAAVANASRLSFSPSASNAAASTSIGTSDAAPTSNLRSCPSPSSISRSAFARARAPISTAQLSTATTSSGAGDGSSSIPDLKLAVGLPPVSFARLFARS
mmetsp:Transcript_2267/g.4938  ORF Transcript_2267/g.4938 Transcript_2267/m.4938 type:complete len:257 (-) Transcript_2267:159-929(-)